MTVKFEARNPGARMELDTGGASGLVPYRPS